MKAIMYHYIRSSSPGLPYLKYLHLDDFKRQLDHFQKEGGFISQKDFFGAFITGIIPDGFILTFDDGLKEHFDTVLPCLKERDLWGIFYIPAGAVSGGRAPAVHTIHRLIGKYSSEKVYNVLAELVDVSRTDYDDNTYVRNDGDLYKVKIKRLLNYHLEDGIKDREDNIMKDGVLKKLEENLSGSTQNGIMEDRFYMTPAEVKSLVDEGMLAGSHSVNHYLMARLSAEEQEKEIKDSFGFIEKASGSAQIRTFCYPFGGVHSYNSITLQLLKKYDCKFAFAVQPRDITKEDITNSPLTMPRYDCNYFPFGDYR
jgi:peptidoglycan/xylan/chitin deacetylase (PgdA/CDA1 family)